MCVLLVCDVLLDVVLVLYDVALLVYRGEKNRNACCRHLGK